jgi:hypothetical protein
MTWNPFKRNLPIVPDDEKDRQEEMVRAQIRLNESLELAKRASEVADTLSEHNRVNHYAQRLRKTYELAIHRGS